jgi:DnaJ-class molecular chaperone
MAKYTYYDVLCIKKESSPEDIKSAYRKLVRKYHQDNNKENIEKFHEINEAYSTLSDREKRSKYDEYLDKGLTNSIEEQSIIIENALKLIVSEYVKEDFNITHYGANHIHPKYLVYWICVKSDKEKNRLQANDKLMEKLRQVLVEYNYPIEGRNSVHIGYESQETVDRESNGNWFHHWK